MTSHCKFQGRSKKRKENANPGKWWDSYRLNKSTQQDPPRRAKPPQQGKKPEKVREMSRQKKFKMTHQQGRCRGFSEEMEREKIVKKKLNK